MKKDHKQIKITPSDKKGDRKVQITLSGELTIYTIEGIKDEIIKAVQDYNDIEIVGENIKNMDLVFIQFINSIQKTTEKLDKQLKLEINLEEDNQVLFDNTDVTRIIRK